MARLRRVTRWPPIGRVGFGDLRRLTPISREWGYDRGQPIDRHYIEHFLEQHAADVRGDVLEVGTNAYTRRFGSDRVSRSEVLHVSDEMPEVTLVADMTRPDSLPPDEFDCIILTQTLQFIYDCREALSTAYRALKPLGVLLVTVPGIAQVSRADMDRWGDYWRFTTLALQRLLEETCEDAHIEISGYGNVLSAIAFLQGLATEELGNEELGHVDPDFQLIVAARIAKRRGAGEATAAAQWGETGQGG